MTTTPTPAAVLCCKPYPRSALPLSFVALLALTTGASATDGGNPRPSFTPGISPLSTACDGEVRHPDWATDVTDNNGDTSQLHFELLAVTNAGIFDKYPYLSWPSYTLSYRIKPGVAAGTEAQITAVLVSADGTRSDPQQWSITAGYCLDENHDGIADPLPDHDADGIPDALDDDDDNDTISDFDEGSGILDSDGDRVPDSLDSDSDNDSIPDADETADSDGDGIRDSREPLLADVSTDSDSDGINDDIDLDDDNDGLSDLVEGLGLVDSDADGIPDSLDLDADNDGRSDLQEAGFDLAGMESENGSLLNPVGQNGLADLLETFPDSGDPAFPPRDSNGDGLADFRASEALLFDDPGGEFNDLSTGLRGSGCAIGSAGSRRDPLLPLLLLFAAIGMVRKLTRD